MGAEIGVISISTAETNYITNNTKGHDSKVLRNDAVSPSLATIEATEEAIINSLFAAQTMRGKKII